MSNLQTYYHFKLDFQKVQIKTSAHKTAQWYKRKIHEGMGAHWLVCPE